MCDDTQNKFTLNISSVFDLISVFTIDGDDKVCCSVRFGITFCVFMYYSVIFMLFSFSRTTFILAIANIPILSVWGKLFVECNLFYFQCVDFLRALYDLLQKI